MTIRSTTLRLALTLALVATLGAGLACDRATAEVTTFEVEGMHCGDCEKAIATTLKEMPSVQAVTADFESGRVTAVHEPATVSAEELAEAIESRGYTVASARTGEVPEDTGTGPAAE